MNDYRLSECLVIDIRNLLFTEQIGDLRAECAIDPFWCRGGADRRQRRWIGVLACRRRKHRSRDVVDRLVGQRRDLRSTATALRYVVRS